MTSQKITAKERKRILHSYTQILQSNYVFQEKVEKAISFLEENLDSGAYNNINDKVEFIHLINSDCDKIIHDTHLEVIYNPTFASSLINPKVDEEEQSSIWDRKEAANKNFGFEKLVILKGNIGYIKLRTFYPPDIGAGEVAVHAMNFFSNCKALIFDLRENSGGEPEMVQFLTTYLFPEEKGTFLLNRVYRRPSNHYDEFWTFPYVPGKRLADLDIFILINHNTVSAAEEFAYNLQNLKRATLVGETTRGGGHMVDYKALDEDFIIQIPIGRAVNPITKTNWENVGVQPDIEAPPDKALLTAHLKALETLIKKSKTKSEQQFLELELKTLKSSVKL